MIKIQKEDIIREIATTTTTDQSAQMLRAITRIAYNAPSSSQTDDIIYDIDVLAQTVVYDMGAEPYQTYRDRIAFMQQQVDSDNRIR